MLGTIPKDRRVRARLGLVAAATMVATVGAAVAVPTAAQAATVHCNSVKYVSVGSGEVAAVPSYKSGSTNTTTCTLLQGDSGDGVETLQLSILQCHSVTVSVDGIFGPATKAALRKVQDKLNIGVDGIYGTQSRKAMSWPSSTDDPRLDCYRVP